MKQIMIKNFKIPIGCLGCPFAHSYSYGWYECLASTKHGITFPHNTIFETTRVNKCPLKEIEVKE